MFGYVSESTVCICSLLLLHISGKIHKQRIFIVSLTKSFFFLFKFSNWLSSGWVSVHLKLGADINQQKPRSVCVANAVITLLEVIGAQTTGMVWRSCRHRVGVPWSCLALLLALFFSSAGPALLPVPLWAFSLDLVLNMDGSFLLFSFGLTWHFALPQNTSEELCSGGKEFKRNST